MQKKQLLLFQDINKGYEGVMRYPMLDEFSVRFLWWHFGIFGILTVLNVYIQLARYIQSPFSWRVITPTEGLIALIIAFFAASLPALLKGRLSNHYLYRLLVTFCLIVYSYLFVFITGGSIEAHFHFFIVMGYISTYADWTLGWVAFLLTAIHHTAVGLLAPSWVFYYGYNLLSPFAHSLPVIAMAGVTTVLCRTHRNALIAQRKLEERKDEFISAASHELKTPITSQKMFLQLLNQEIHKNNDQQYARYVSKTIEQTNKLTRLINDLLDVSKIQSGKMQLELERFSLTMCAKNVIEDFQGITKSHKLVLEGSIKKHIVADKQRISQVLTNLISNAIKYSPQTSDIIVTLKGEEKFASMTVKDFGIGIAQKHRPLIFGRFFRVSGSDERTFPGLGMGLYIASQIVRQHGGKITVVSKKGKGSAFTVSLPYTPKR